jgi:hypothetical protein
LRDAQAALEGRMEMPVSGRRDEVDPAPSHEGAAIRRRDYGAALASPHRDTVEPDPARRSRARSAFTASRIIHHASMID